MLAASPGHRRGPQTRGFRSRCYRARCHPAGSCRAQIFGAKSYPAASCRVKSYLAARWRVKLHRSNLYAPSRLQAIRPGANGSSRQQRSPLPSLQVMKFEVTTPSAWIDTAQATDAIDTQSVDEDDVGSLLQLEPVHPLLSDTPPPTGPEEYPADCSSRSRSEPAVHAAGRGKGSGRRACGGHRWCSEARGQQANDARQQHR